MPVCVCVAGGGGGECSCFACRSCQTIHHASSRGWVYYVPIMAISDGLSPFSTLLNLAKEGPTYPIYLSPRLLKPITVS